MRPLKKPKPAQTAIQTMGVHIAAIVYLRVKSSELGQPFGMNPRPNMFQSSDIQKTKISENNRGIPRRPSSLADTVVAKARQS